MKKTYSTPLVTSSNAARETKTGDIRTGATENLVTSFVAVGFGL